MAIRDHYRLDVLARRAAELQQADAELDEVQRLLAGAEAGVHGQCRSCGAVHSRGAAVLLALRRRAARGGAPERARTTPGRLVLSAPARSPARRIGSAGERSLQRRRGAPRPVRRADRARGAAFGARGGARRVLGARWPSPRRRSRGAPPRTATRCARPRAVRLPVLPATTRSTRTSRTRRSTRSSAGLHRKHRPGAAPAPRLRHQPRLRHPLRGRRRRTSRRCRSSSPNTAPNPTPGPYPIPPNAPVEGGGRRRRPARARAAGRHAASCTSCTRRARTGAGWEAGSGAVFNLRSNALRPEGWTSADAAGLPIFPLLARYQEVRAGRDRPRAARDRAAHAARLHPPGDPLRLQQHRPERCRRWACACA